MGFVSCFVVGVWNASTCCTGGVVICVVCLVFCLVVIYDCGSRWLVYGYWVFICWLCMVGYMYGWVVLG